MRTPVRDGVALGRSAVVGERHPVPCGGSGQSRVIGDELMEARDDVEAVLDRVMDDGEPLGRDVAACRREADQQRGRPERQCIGEGRDDRGDDRPTASTIARSPPRIP